MKKRVLPLFLALVMCLGMLPHAALAVDPFPYEVDWEDPEAIPAGTVFQLQEWDWENGETLSKELTSYVAGAGAYYLPADDEIHVTITDPSRSGIIAYLAAWTDFDGDGVYTRRTAWYDTGYWYEETPIIYWNENPGEDGRLSYAAADGDHYWEPDEEGYWEPAGAAWDTDLWYFANTNEPIWSGFWPSVFETPTE